MRYIIGLLLIAVSVSVGVWWWRREYEPSPLEVHLADLQVRSNIGQIVTAQHYVARPAFTTVGAGVLTGTRVNPNNPASSSNRGGRLQLYTRSPVQP